MPEPKHWTAEKMLLNGVLPRDAIEGDTYRVATGSVIEYWRYLGDGDWHRCMAIAPKPTKR